MPLSEEEMRLLEQMERALVAEDPKFVSALRGTARRRGARRRALLAAGVFVVGVTVLMTGAITQNTIVGILGFVVMLGSAVVGLTAWRNQGAPVAQEAPTPGGAPTAGIGLSVVEGGKKSRKRSSRPKPANNQSMMQRFEERWRRRRGGDGY